MISVSYLNDYEFHCEWLHPFYASLQYELSSEEVDVRHFIILNDDSKNEARKNIEEVISMYDLDFYNPVFIPVNVDPVLKKSGSAHHGAGFNEGVGVISNDYRDSVKKSHLILIEEFDLIHKDGYYSNLKDLYKLSHLYNSFFGTVDPGTLKISEERVDRGENLGLRTEKRGEIKSKDGDLYFWAPRILPHFFGFSSDLFDEFIAKESGFRDKITDYASYHSIEKTSDGVKIYNDTGSDLIKDLFKDNRFFHMDDVNFICHVKGVTYVYSKTIGSDKSVFNSENIFSVLENKFNFIKTKFYYLPFSQDSLFAKEKFEKEI